MPDNPFSNFAPQETRNPFASFAGKSDYVEPQLQAPIEVKGQVTQGKYGQDIQLDPTREDYAGAIGIEGGEAGAKVRIATATGTAEDVRNQLANQYGISPDEVELNKDPNVGYIYKTPSMKEYALIDPVGLDMGDLAKGLEVIPSVLGGIGAVATGFMSKSPVAAAAAAAGGATATKAVQMSILKGLGIINPPAQKIAIDSLSEGALEFLGGVAPSVGKGILKMLPTDWAARNRAVTELSKRIDPEDLAAGRVKSSEIADIMEQETGVRPKFTTGQELGLVEPERAAAIQGLEDVTNISVEAKRSQRIASEALQDKLKPSETDFIKEKASSGIKEVATATKETAISSIKNIQDVTVKKLERLKGNLPQGEASELGANLRRTLEKGKDQAYAPLKKAYTEFDEEFSDILVDMKVMKEAAATLEKEGVIFPDWMPDRKTAISQASKTESNVGFSDVQAALSDIRSKVRNMREAGASVPEINAVNKIKDSLKSARDQALQSMSPEKANKLLALEGKYAAFKDATNKSIVKSILKKGSDSRYIVADKSLINNILKNADDIKMYKDIAMDQPTLNVLPQMREALLVKYRNAVIDGGGTHGRFMQENKSAINELMTPKEKVMMKTAHRAKAAIPLALKREGELIKQLKDTLPEYNLSNFQSTKVMDALKGDVRMSNNIKKMLKNHPQKWKHVQEARKFDIASKSDTLGGLKSLVKNEGSEISATLGKDYLNSLNAALKVSDLMSKRLSGKELKDISGKGGLDLARAIVFGPLSHAGYIRGMASNVLESKARRLTSELLQNSVMLEKVLKAHKIKDSKRSAKAIAYATGVGLWQSDNELDVKEKDLRK